MLAIFFGLFTPIGEMLAYIFLLNAGEMLANFFLLNAGEMLAKLVSPQCRGNAGQFFLLNAGEMLADFLFYQILGAKLTMFIR